MAVEEGKENDNTAWVTTFEEYLEECRGKETDEDIVILEDNPKQQKKERKQLVEDLTVINKGKLSEERQKTREVLESSESDEDSCNEVVLDDCSDDDWDSFRAKQIMNIEDHIEDNIDDNIEDNNQESIHSHPTLQPINKQLGSFVIVRYV
ncbi:hypothetical protein JTB14_007772 [Gonioctena quinquepunctata]|nr:hypothetical protein JTB14_007772 [Gonioctena quinquepunctata]